MLPLRIAPLCLLVTCSFGLAVAESGLSGIVHDKQGIPLDGVTVRLASGNESSLTTKGLWSFGGATSIASWRPHLPVKPNGHLKSVGGRLVVSFGDRSFSGRLLHHERSTDPAEQTGQAGRASLLADDTLVYSLNGRTLSKRPLAGLAPQGILQIVDTSTDATHGVPWSEKAAYRTIQDTRDGQYYRIVKVGRQSWFAENLNFAIDSSFTYPGIPSSGALYGRLYTWAGALSLPNSCNWESCTVTTPTRGLCPEGFHVPDTAEWRMLEDTVMSLTSANEDNLGTMFRSTAGWIGLDGTAKPGLDSLGLRVLPAGNRYDNGTFNHAGERTFLHSATPFDAGTVWARQITLDWGGVVSEYYYGKSHLLSVRCVSDTKD